MLPAALANASAFSAASTCSIRALFIASKDPPVLVFVVGVVVEVVDAVIPPTLAALGIVKDS